MAEKLTESKDPSIRAVGMHARALWDASRDLTEAYRTAPDGAVLAEVTGAPPPVKFPAFDDLHIVHQDVFTHMIRHFPQALYDVMAEVMAITPDEATLVARLAYPEEKSDG